MYAVITGASSGFGVQFAIEFAKKGYNICIAARRIENLNALKNKIENEFGVLVDILAVDLAQDKGIIQLYDFTKNKNVDVLINNAGIAYGGMPDQIHIDKELEMLDINVKTMHYLTRLYLKDMLLKNSGCILNVSSLSAWLPVPLLSAYAAGKAYILHLSEGINFELKRIKSNVYVSVVTPGFFNTGIADEYGKISEQNRSVPEFIKKVVQQFLNGKETIVVGKDKQIMILTRLTFRFIAKSVLFKNVSKIISEKKES